VDDARKVGNAAKTGLTKRQAAVCLLEPPPFGPEAWAAPGGRHDSQAALHSKGMIFWLLFDCIPICVEPTGATLCD